MSFKLTFNRPAVRQFIEGGDAQGLKIRIADHKVQFMVADGDDTARLEPRTRGGYEAFVEGTGAEQLLANLKNPAGPFYVLRRVDKDWVQAEPYTGKDAPPKFEPHVRVWHSSVPKKSKSASRTTTKRPSAPSLVVNNPEPIDIAERVRWAYGKLNEERRPGRPSREFMEAKAVKESFEAAAMEFMSDLTSKKVDVDAIVAAYRQIGDFLKTAAPEALTGGEIKTKARKPKVVPTPAEVTDAVAVVTEAAKSGDEQAEEGIRVALQKLGLEEKPPTMSRKVRGRIPARAFGGEGLVA